MSSITPAEAFDAFFRIVETILVPGIVYLGTRINNVDRKIDGVRSKVDKVDTVLIGPDGRNGIRSRIRRLESKVEHLALQQAARHGEAQPVQYDSDEDDED